MCRKLALVAVLGLFTLPASGDPIQRGARTATSRSPSGIHYRVAGPRHGRPIVLLHGNGNDLHSFDDVVDALAQTHLTLTFDQRGQGQTPRAGNDYSTTRMAHDLKELVTHEKLGPFHLVGHSMGGRTAVRYAALYPGDVRSVLVEDMELHSRGPLRPIPSPHPQSPAVLHGEQAGSEDLLPGLRALRAPMMLLMAQNGSAVSPLGFQLMHRARPDMAAILMPGSDHFIHLSKSESFLKLMHEHNEDAEQGRRWTPRPWALK